MTEKHGEVFVSVDIETSGPYSTRYALLSIGACLVDDPDRSFYVELQPTSFEAFEEADEPGENWATQVEAVRAEVINIVNNFFHDRLVALPTINAYIDSFQTESP